MEAITVPASRTDFLSREQFLHNAIDWLAGTTLVPVNSYIPQVVPELHGLLSLFPNPVHLSGKDSGLTIRFQLPGHVIPTRIQVYDLLGRRICSLDLSPAQKRRREISLVPGRKSNLHSGVYFVVLEAERLKLTKKFLVLR